MLGRCLHRTECANSLLLNEELGGVDFGGRWTGVPSSEARSGSTPPVSPPSGFCLRPLPVLRDYIWCILGRSKGNVTCQGGEGGCLTP